MKASAPSVPLETRQSHMQALYDYTFDGSMHLPQLFSPESAATPSFVSPLSLNNMDIECSQNLLRLTSSSSGLVQHERFSGDWSFLDKLLASHQSLDHNLQNKCNASSQVIDVGTSSQRFPFHYLGCESDFLKFAK